MIALLVFLFSLTSPDSTRNQLPDIAQRVLDSRLTVQWKLCNSFFYRCDLNGDSLPDYALEVSVGADSCLVEYYVALIASNQSYAFHLLSARPVSFGLAGQNEFHLRRKGELVPDFGDDGDEPKHILLKADVIECVPIAGCCAVIFLYRNGTFDVITSSD